MLKVVEVSPEESGFRSLMGKNVFVMCNSYFYWGRLVGVNERFILLDHPHIVYETGGWSDSKFRDAQALGPHPLMVMTQAIESCMERNQVY